MTSEYQSDFQTRLEKINAEEINYRYEQEDRMINLVARGNYEEYKEMMRMEDAPDNFDVRVKRLENDPLRDRKNGLTTRKTLLRIGARRGGVPPVYLHLISEKYSILIEQATSTDYLDNYLAADMAKTFCDIVNEISVKSYTPTIQSAIQHIDSNLTGKLSVQTIAEEIHVHPTYLSRKFKQETGKNLTDYVNNQRVNFAVLQFHSGKEDITNVALSCGYSSSSYFSKVFKKHIGLSPSDFINNITGSNK